MDLGDMINDYKKQEVVDVVKEYTSRKPTKAYQKEAEKAAKKE
jgi:hypothetical protein